MSWQVKKDKLVVDRRMRWPRDAAVQSSRFNGQRRRSGIPPILEL